MKRLHDPTTDPSQPDSPASDDPSHEDGPLRWQPIPVDVFSGCRGETFRRTIVHDSVAGGGFGSAFAARRNGRLQR